MLVLTLAGSAFLMGLAGSLHCAAMCAAPCAAMTGGDRSSRWALQVGRLLGYAAGGAAVAASVGGLLRWETVSGALRPVWLAMHLGLLALGVFLLWRARWPAWMQRIWSPRTPELVGLPAVALMGGGVATVPVRPRRSRPALIAGMLWLAWPCGLLQAALMVAALADGPWQGAAVMAAFALGSSPGLAAGTGLLAWRPGSTRGAGGATSAAADGGRSVRLATRLSGGMLAAGALWALGHGMWAQIRAYCG